MRFGLQRSLIFWSGLLAVVFLMGAWRDSREWRWYVRAGSFELASVNGGVVLEGEHYGLPGFAAGRESTIVVRPALVGPFLLHGRGEAPPVDSAIDASWDYQELCSYGMGSRPRGDWLVFMPYWLLLMAAGVVWWLLLVWRQRRGIDWGQET